MSDQPNISDLVEEPLGGAMKRASSVSEWQLVASMAISAKRIADYQERQARALENIAESICGEYGIGAAIWKLTK